MPQYPALPKQSSYDVVIVGGAMIGSSVAWFLSSDPGFSGNILVVEKDPTYAYSSTAHTNSCIRQQFSTEINVRMSQFGADYIKNFRAYMGDDPRIPDVTLENLGYLYLADNKDFANTLSQNQKMQNACGVGTRMMTPEQIAHDYPFYCLDDIVAGSHNPIDEGFFDGNILFDWWKRRAKENGVEFIANEVVAMSVNRTGTEVQEIRLKSGGVLSCGLIVNASGPRAARTSQMAGIDIPVEPRKRYTFVFSAAKPLDRPMPLTINPSGVHLRSDGTYYMAGCTPDPDPAVAYGDFEQDHSIWEDKVWPAIAFRIPQFEALKVVNSWVGHYAYNTLDQNAILGPHSKVRNFIFANGFSGHGFQHSPAVGRGIAELIVTGGYQSLDLTPFEYIRVPENRPIVEKAII